MKSVLKMVLSLPGNKTVTYSLADPKDGIGKAEVEAVLDEMVTKRAVVVNGDFATAVKEAYIQKTERQELV